MHVANPMATSGRTGCMHPQPASRSMAALCVAIGLLPACGGGSPGLVRPSLPPVNPTAPLPPPAPPAYTRQGDVLVDAPGAVELRDTRTPGALTKDGPGALTLSGISRFDNGARVLGGSLIVDELLYSNIAISPGASLKMVTGSTVGNVDNSGLVEISGCGVWDYGSCGRIAGNYVHGAGATWRHQLGAQLTGARQVAHVTGTATLAGGTVEFYQASPYATGTPYVEHILHADGGVSGRFDRWTSPGLFVTGALRYASNDVYFDLMRISLQATLAGSGKGSALTLASAGNLDRAFQRADLFALLPPGSLSIGQRRFLQSSASVQQIGTFDQAVASLDSLSGHQQANGLLLLAMDQALPASATSWRLDRIRPGRAAGAWTVLAGHAVTDGLDRWLGPRVIAGSRVVSHPAGTGAAAYLRGFDERGWYAGGELGHARQALAVSRFIDLGPGGSRGAHSRRNIDITQARVEGGRQLSVGGGTLTSFASLDAVSLRSGRVREQGGTGFELVLSPQWDARLFAGTGLRYGRDWRIGQGWLRLEAGTGYLRQLARAGGPLQAAFLGIPDLWFDVPADVPAAGRWHALGLRAGAANGWAWSLDYRQPYQGARARPDWWMGVRRRF